MATRTMNLDVLVRLRDLLSGPLRRLRSGLEKITGLARKIGLVGTAIAAISLMAPIREAAAFQQQLLDIAGTANLTGNAAFTAVEQMKGQFEGLALSIGQYSDTIAKGAGEMIAAGIDRKIIDASISDIGRAATAANAEFSDMASVSTSLLQNLKMPATELNNALGALVTAGKEGAFELKDMSRYLPTLTGQMEKFGVTGREAVNFLGSALQIARKGTADPAEAANNLKNFLSKILAPTTVKSFKDAGVDIQSVMQDAATKGINPIEAVMQKIVMLTGVSGSEIGDMMKKATVNGLQGAEALAEVRQQLEKIHGAGSLGELFSDMQVMDFLIPFLGNIDEYKRIKAEVASATGAIIDDDFNTQMAGLNRQLITFGEIGSQVSREVGLAFGTWMPAINEGLSDALKWMRELDASTGGMVREGIAFAGAAILVTAGLGALGLALPVIAAGFGALMTLIGPVGLVLGAVGLGAKHIYDNWGSYGPRLFRTWDRMKTGMAGLVTSGRQMIDRYGPIVQRGFENIWSRAGGGISSLVASIRDATPRIVEAGREMVGRYGPIISGGFASAWADVEAGWKHLQKLFEGFSKGLDLKIDMSGLTIDDAKVGLFKTLDSALAGIGRGWNAMKDFGSGFAPYLEDIGKNLGGTINSITGIADGVVRLAGALGQMVGLGDGKIGMIFEKIGAFAGGLTREATGLVRDLAGGLEWTFKGLASVAEAVNKGINWSSLLPEGLVSTWTNLAEAINSVKNALSGITIGSVIQPGDTLHNGTVAGNPDDGSDREASLTDNLALPPRIPANNNRTEFAPAVGPVQPVKADVTVNFKIDGPGQVTAITSNNSNVTGAPSPGRAVGRP